MSAWQRDDESHHEARALINGILSRTETGSLLEAIAEDIQTTNANAALAAEVAAAAEARLVRIETTVQALTDATIALTHTVAEIAITVQDLKHQITGKQTP